MTVQKLNAESVDLMRPFFVGRNEPNFSWQISVGSHLFLPGVTGFWPGSVQGNGVTPDATGNGQTMTLNTVTLTNIGIAPCFSIPNTTSYLNTADGVLNSPTSAMFFTCWMRFSSLGATQGIINKWGAAGQRSFKFYKTSSNGFTWENSADGTIVTGLNSSGSLVVADTWYHLAINFSTAGGIDYWINNVLRGSTGGGSAIFDGTADLELGRATNGGTDGLRGYMSLPTFGLTTMPEIYFNTMYQYEKALYGYN